MHFLDECVTLLYQRRLFLGIMVFICPLLILSSSGLLRFREGPGPLSGRLGPPSGRLTPLSGGFSPLSGRFAPLSRRLGPLSRRLGLHATRHGALSRRPAPLSRRFAAVSRGIGFPSRKLVALCRKFSPPSRALGPLSRDLRLLLEDLVLSPTPSPRVTKKAWPSSYFAHRNTLKVSIMYILTETSNRYTLLSEPS